MDRSGIQQVARDAQQRILWLATIQIDELATRYLQRGKVRSASDIAQSGVDVSENYLRLMEQKGR